MDKDNKLFLSGKNLAYYEVLLTIQNRLISNDEELKDYGLDICLEKEIVYRFSISAFRPRILRKMIS